MAQRIVYGAKYKVMENHRYPGGAREEVVEGEIVVAVQSGWHSDTVFIRRADESSVNRLLQVPKRILKKVPKTRLTKSKREELMKKLL